ncbi:MAG: calcium/sodium antiporter [Flavobacteriaceae bacterium]|nr:calcium/sodium antiporter [Flavobacteriaceae bacterium]
MNIAYVVLGFIILIKGGDWLLKASVNFSLRLNISKIIIGMTVVSFATSAPELIVSISAASTGHSDLSLGNVVGSNIANIALVLGVTLLLGNISVGKRFYTLDLPIVMFSSLLLYYFLSNNNQLDFYEGVIMIVLLVSFICYMLFFNKDKKAAEEVEEDENPNSLTKDLLILVLGGVALWGGSELLVLGAVGIATEFGISERIIGVTIISIGTSIPELATSIMAVIKKEKAISLGNLLGSNIFNILAVLGITSVIQDIKVVDSKLMSNDILWMIAVPVVLLGISLLSKGKLGKIGGAVLLSVYISFVYFTL